MSKNVKATFQYLGRNWVSVFAHVIIPAVIYTVLINPTSSFDFIISQIDTLEVNSFLDIFKMINDSSKWQSWEYVVGFFAIAIITLVVFSSFVGRTQNRMRYGRPLYSGFKGVLKRTNENMFSTIKCGIAVYVTMEVFAFAMSLILFVTIKLAKYAVAKIVIILLFGTIGIILIFYILAWAACTLPNMTMRGIGFFKSITISMNVVAPHIKQVFIDLLIPLVISYIPILVFSALDIVFDHMALTIIRYIANFVFYTFSFVYYILYMYIIFFDFNELEREDINQENRWRIS